MIKGAGKHGQDSGDSKVDKHFTQAVIKQKLLAKRKVKNASALIPNAALNAARKMEDATQTLPYVEIILTLAETGDILPQVQVHHKHKGGGQNPEEIGS